jgi:hypothetical protein
MFIRASCAYAYTRSFRPTNIIFRLVSLPRLNKFDRAGQAPIYYKRFSSVTFRVNAGSTKGFPYIIILNSVLLMFELHRVFLVSARMRKVTLEKRLYTRTHATDHIAHPLL